jgi:hypothetical protein
VALLARAPWGGRGPGQPPVLPTLERAESQRAGFEQAHPASGVAPGDVGSPARAEAVALSDAAAGGAPGAPGATGDVGEVGGTSAQGDGAGSAPPGGAAGEREHYRAFLALASRDPAGLFASAPTELLGDGPDPRKVALLRALFDTDPGRAVEHFAHAITALPDSSGPHGGSVPAFAIRHLGQRAGHDPAARAALRAVTFGEQRAAHPALRQQAARHLARLSTEPELQELAPVLRVEDDELLRAVFAAGLLENGEGRTVDLLFSDLLAAREALAGEGDSLLDSDLK